MFGVLHRLKCVGFGILVVIFWLGGWQVSAESLDDRWKMVLELDENRSLRQGSSEDLVAAIRRGADLRVMTEFKENEHVDTDSDSDELIREVCDFQITYLVDNRWSAGIMQLRQPVSLPHRFGGRPSMSFFLYNQDGEQGIARPFLDGQPASNQLGSGPGPDHPNMPKMHQHDNLDDQTNAPSHNFIYDFDVFRYFVRDDWQQVLEHDDQGVVQSGSVKDLAAAFTAGRQVKLALRNLCSDLPSKGEVNQIEHEVFTRGSSCYYYTKQNLFITGADPLIRVGPCIPLQYSSGGWDVSWVMARTDGFAVQRLLNPRTLQFEDREGRYAMRWFVR